MMADTVAWVRHYNRWQRWPFPLLTSADKCLPQAQRASIGRRLSGACLFCLDEYCGQRVVSQMVNPEREVFEEKWQCALYEIADMLNLQSDRVERKAGHNKAIFSKQVQADYLTAKSMLVDVQANARALARVWQEFGVPKLNVHIPNMCPPSLSRASIHWRCGIIILLPEETKRLEKCLTLQRQNTTSESEKSLTLCSRLRGRNMLS